jgi:hypothetical protein
MIGEVLVVLDAASGSPRPSARVSASSAKGQAAKVTWVFLVPPAAMAGSQAWPVVTTA